MKYILIGGSGFIGQHFRKILSDDIILNLDIDEGVNNTSFQNCNILNSEELSKFSGSFDEDITLIHLAAVHFDFQKFYFETNVNGTENILNFISENDRIKKYVFFSSVATYGNSEFGKDENSVQDPVNDYGKSKLEAEKIILNWHKKHTSKQVIIIRPAVVFGEYNFGNVFNLIQQIRNGFFAIIGDGKNIKSIAYAGNIVDSVLFCLNNIDEPLYIYNYCDYPQMHISDQSNLISSLLSKIKPIRISFFLTKIITIPIDLLEKIIGKDLKINSMRVKKFTVSTYFKSDKIRKSGYKQITSIEEALRNTNEWILSVKIKKIRNKWYTKASKL